MRIDPLLTAINALVQIVPESAAEVVLRQAVADLGAQVGAPKDRGQVASAPMAAKPAPMAAKSEAPKSAKKPPNGSVVMSQEVMDWLAAASPVKVAAAIGGNRVSVYNWRERGTISPQKYEALIALMKSGTDVSPDKKAPVGAPSQSDQDQSSNDIGQEDQAAIELEIAARAAADGLTREELLELCSVSGTDTPKDRARIARVLATL